jgi:hypothetical protein
MIKARLAVQLPLAQMLVMFQVKVNVSYGSYPDG